MAEGYIKLWRALLDNPVWLAEPFTKAQAWVDLLLLANHKPGSITIRGVCIQLERGQVGLSEYTLAERWRWSRNKVRYYLRYCKKESQIVLQKNNVTTIVTIANYDRWQGEGTAKGTTEKPAKGTADCVFEGAREERSLKNIPPPLLTESGPPKKPGKTELLAWWNQIAQKYTLPGVRYISDSRWRKFQVRDNQMQLWARRVEIVQAIEDSCSFLRSGTWFSLDWLLSNDTNVLKLLEGNYVDKGKGRRTKAVANKTYELWTPADEAVIDAERERWG